MPVIGRGQIELTSNADDVNRGFANVISTFARTNEATKTVQAEVLKLTNANRELVAEMERLNAKHQGIIAAMGALTKGSAEYKEIKKQEAAILKEIDQAEEKYIAGKAKIAAATQKLATVTAEAGGGIRAFGTILTDFAMHPVATAQNALGALLTGMGPTAVGIAGIATAAGIAAMGLHKMAEEARNYAQAVQNQAFRTGLTTGQVQAVNRAGEELGLGDNLATTLGAVQRMMGKPEGNEMTSRMAALGVVIKDTTGKIRPLLDILGDFSELLKRIPDVEERAQVANATLGRRLESLTPILLNTNIHFRDFIKNLEDEVPMSEKAIAAAAEHRQEVNRIAHEWEEAKLKVGEFWSAVEMGAKNSLAKMIKGEGSYTHGLPGSPAWFGALGRGQDPRPSSAYDASASAGAVITTGFGGLSGMAAISAREGFLSEMNAVMAREKDDLDLRMEINREKEKYAALAGTENDPAKIRAQADMIVGLEKELEVRKQLRTENEALAKMQDERYHETKRYEAELQHREIEAGEFRAQELADWQKLKTEGIDKAMASVEDYLSKQAEAVGNRPRWGAVKPETAENVFARISGDYNKDYAARTQAEDRAGRDAMTQQQQIFDHWKDAAARTWDAVTASGENMWSNLLNYGKTTLLTIAREIFSNFVAQLFSNQSGNGQGGGNSIGSLFSNLGNNIANLFKRGGGGGNAFQESYIPGYTPGTGTASGLPSLLGGLGSAAATASSSTSSSAASMSQYTSAANAGASMVGSAMLQSASQSGSVGMGVGGGALAGAGIGGSIVPGLGHAIGAGIGALVGYFAGAGARAEKRREEEATGRLTMQGLNYSDMLSPVNMGGPVERDITGRANDWSQKSRGGLTVTVQSINLVDGRHAKEAAQIFGAELNRLLQSGSTPLRDTMEYQASMP